MARLVTTGFELQDDSASTLSSAPDGSGGGVTPTVETTIVRTGSASCKFGAGGSRIIDLASAVALGADAFARVYLYVVTGGLPVSNRTAVLTFRVTNTSAFAVTLETDGTLTLRALIGGSVWTQEGSASAAVTLDSWENLVELRGRTDTGSVDQCEARLGGVTFASASGLGVSDGQISRVAVGPQDTNSAAATACVDDLAVNDTSGASQTSWPPASKIAYLGPISDSAVGTGWTLGTGTAIASNSGSTAVKNKPPLGVADLAAGSDTKQIRNASSNANVNYDANLTTYTSAGVGANDTVNVLVPMVATAAPVTTSSKQGTIGVSSNPVIANVALGAGGTAGAFWAGSAAAAYPSGWKWSFGTTTYNPPVTKGVSPVARITQVTASTRIAVVCAMGMYVDFTPAGQIPPSVQPHLIYMRKNR